MEDHLFYAELCKDAYNDEIIRDGYKSLFFNNNHSQAHLLISKDHQIIVCRGTEKKKSEILDWIVDMIMFTDEGIHIGFKYYTELLFDDIMNHIDHNKPLIFAGHSLGAAMALIMASYCKSDFDIHVYTYGCPRVGTKSFIGTIGKHIIHHRWLTAHDHSCIIPFYPYIHHSEMLYICSDNIHRKVSFMQRMIDRVCNKWKNSHHIDNYINAFRKMLNI
jgi:hypothetical protein